MEFLLSSKLRGELLRQLTAFSPADNFLVLPECTMPHYVSDEAGWERYFGSGGILSEKIRAALAQAGADPGRVFFHRYLSEQPVRLSDYSCLILPGGDAELGVKRLTCQGLDRQLADYRGRVIAYSAGALLLLDQYFLSPNYYYKTFSVHRGLNILPGGFALEVHYNGSDEMDSYIRQGLQELDRGVWAIGNDGAMKIAPGSPIQTTGTVQWFGPENAGGNHGNH